MLWCCPADKMDVCAGTAEIPSDRLRGPAAGWNGARTGASRSSAPPAERAAEERRKADQLACEAWNKRMLGATGPARPTATVPAIEFTRNTRPSLVAPLRPYNLALASDTLRGRRKWHDFDDWL